LENIILQLFILNSHISGDWHPIVQHTYHSNTIQNYRGGGLGMNHGDSYNPSTYSNDYAGSKNAYERRTITAEQPLQYFVQTIPTTFTLKRADISLNSVSKRGFNQEYNNAVEAENQSHHKLHAHSKSSNKTIDFVSNNNKKIATYLTPPQPQTSLLGTLVKLQQVTPRKRHYNVRHEHKLMDILTALHILPHPEELDYF
jgi:hypothetical protein